MKPARPDSQPDRPDILEIVDFEKGGGLVTAIAQDDASGEVLMVAYMNEESLRRSLELGEVVYWSRSRKKLWHKGEESGNVQKLKGLYVDCDGDAARRSGWSRSAGPLVIRASATASSGASTLDRIEEVGVQVFDPEEVYRQVSDAPRLRIGLPKGSLQETTKKLFRARGLRHPLLRPFLLPLDRRPGARVHPDPPAGDGALRRARA